MDCYEWQIFQNLTTVKQLLITKFLHFTPPNQSDLIRQQNHEKATKKLWTYEAARKNL